MDFEAYFKVHSLVSVHLKNIKFGQMTNLNMIIDWLKFETRPRSLLNFEMANWRETLRQQQRVEKVASS